MNCNGFDDVIVTSLNRVRFYPCIINPNKFGEDRMKNARVIVFTRFLIADRRSDAMITIYLSWPRGKNETNREI